MIAIVLALSGLVTMALFKQRDAAKVDLARTDMNSLKGALDLFRLDFDRYPTDEEGLAVLWDRNALSSEDEAGKWKGYLKEPMPNDRWGTPWGYRQQSEFGDETRYDLWSNGPDKEEGSDDDIRSWTEEEAGGAGAGLPPPPS